MKDVISVDTTTEQILVHLAGCASICWTPKPKGVFDPELATKGVDEAQAQLHSLLISKLPEKREMKGYNVMPGYNNNVEGFNSAISDVKAVLAELFGVEQ